MSGIIRVIEGADGKRTYAYTGTQAPYDTGLTIGELIKELPSAPVARAALTDMMATLADYESGAAAGGGLNSLAAEVHQNAVEHGWWENPRTLPEILMLCVSELSEALEEHRNGRTPNQTRVNCPWHDTREGCADKHDGCGYGENAGCTKGKPEGIPSELADCIIRILDYCGYAGIDIDGAIAQKHKYNKTRPYKHGGKVC